MYYDSLGIQISGSCGPGTYNNLRSEITTPNYPDNYPNNRNCNWDIIASSGRIELEFEEFALEYDSSCIHDFLDIYNGGTISSTRRIGSRLCGRSRPSNKISSGNQMHLRWKSDGVTVRRGFKIKVKIPGKYK